MLKTTDMDKVKGPPPPSWNKTYMLKNYRFEKKNAKDM